MALQANLFLNNIANTFLNWILSKSKNTIYKETVLVQINNSKAYKLLEDLEELDILKVLSKSISSNTNSVGKNESNIKKTMADFSGMLSESAYKSLKEHAQVARKEYLIDTNVVIDHLGNKLP